MTLPTEPHERLLDRHSGKIGNKEYLDALDRAFCGIINETTWIFSRVAETTKGDFDAEVCLLLLRHILEMADAVHVLLLASSSRPAHLQLRSMFEALLYLEFILQEDTHRRVLAYAIGSRLWSIRIGRRLLEGSEARRQFVTEIETDPLVTQDMIDDWVTTEEELRPAETYLEGEFFRDVYDLFKRHVKKNPRWYAVIDGKPSDLRALAIHLCRGGQYILFDHWSRSIHPDLIPVQLDLDEGTMRVLRDADGIGLVANSAARILRSAVELVLATFRPEELAPFQLKADREINPMFAELGPTDVQRVKLSS